jgi:methionine-gamma-lyase
MSDNRSFFTKAVHAGAERGEHFGAVSTPIYQSTVFGFSDADEAAAVHNHEKPGFYYGRLGNPTQAALERTMSELEGGEDALALASGMAAISAAVLTFAKAGDHIVAPGSMYSTTTNMLRHLADRFGIETSFVARTDAADYRAAARPSTKLFWIETPSNPVLNVTDIAAVCAVAKELGILAVVDNTFATPFNQQPLFLGADLSVHSATKYLGGHSDLTAGALIGRRDLIGSVRSGPAKLFGGNIAPQIAWLLARGIKTLALRMERHNFNAYALANMLEGHAKVCSVRYPGLASHPENAIARRQMSGFGGMVAFDLGSQASAKAFENSLELCTLATSLGGVETIVQHSASMTHAAISKELREAAGISDGLIRMSVGIEAVDDLAQDINRALAAI